MDDAGDFGLDGIPWCPAMMAVSSCKLLEKLLARSPVPRCLTADMARLNHELSFPRGLETTLTSLLNPFTFSAHRETAVARLGGVWVPGVRRRSCVCTSYKTSRTCGRPSMAACNDLDTSLTPRSDSNKSIVPSMIEMMPDTRSGIATGGVIKSKPKSPDESDMAAARPPCPKVTRKKVCDRKPMCSVVAMLPSNVHKEREEVERNRKSLHVCHVKLDSLQAHHGLKFRTLPGQESQTVRYSIFLGTFQLRLGTGV